jgi:hypothetical protein
MQTRFAMAMCSGWVLTLCLAAPAESQVAQQVQRSPVTSAPVPAKLGEAYIDKNFAYSIRPPLNFVGSFRKTPGSEGGLQLAQFVSTTHEAWLTIRYAQSDHEISQEELLNGLKAEILGGRQKAVLHRAELSTVAGRPAAVCDVTLVLDEKSFVRHQAVVRFQPDEVFIITFNAAQTDLGASRKTFAAVLGSFELPRTDVSRKVLAEAMENGLEWLSALRARGLPDAGNKEALYWRYERNGKPIGFLRVNEQSKVQDGLPGVQIRERAWLFGEGQSYQDIQNTIFLSLDLRTESWENLVQSRAELAGKTQLIHDLNKAARGDNRLALSFTEHPGDMALTTAVRTVPTTYIPMALIRVFPRLVDLKKPRTYAFSSYNVENREMVIRVLKVIGRAKATGVQYSGPVYKVEDNEGLFPPVTEIYADEAGRILKVVQSNLTMFACTREEVDAVFKERMVMADALYKKSMAQQEEAWLKLMGPRPDAAGGKNTDEKHGR